MHCLVSRCIWRSYERRHWIWIGFSHWADNLSIKLVINMTTFGVTWTHLQLTLLMNAFIESRCSLEFSQAFKLRTFFESHSTTIKANGVMLNIDIQIFVMSCLVSLQREVRLLKVSKQFYIIHWQILSFFPSQMESKYCR